MKHKCTMLLIYAAVLTVLLFCIAAVSAQTTDLENMDNAQMMELLQSIMQKLQQEESTEAEALPEESDLLQITPEILESASVRRLSVYRNKKLIIGEMPEYYFIRPVINDSEENGDDTQPTKSPTKTPEEIHNCPPGYTYACYTDILTGQYVCNCGIG